MSWNCNSFVGFALVLAAFPAYAQSSAQPGPADRLQVDRERFVQLDQDHDHFLSREEARQDNVANAYFQTADSDGDNRLSETEYLAIAHATAFGPANGTNGTGGASGSPGSGKTEPLLGPPNVEEKPGPGTGPTGGRGGSSANDSTMMLVPVTPAAAAEDFSRLDQNGDGVLSQEEAQAGKITDRFTAADQDNDGQISDREYQAFVRSESGIAIGSPPSGDSSTR